MAGLSGRRGQSWTGWKHGGDGAGRGEHHLAHLSVLFSWIAVHAPAGLLPHGDPTKKVEPLRLPAPQVRALAGPQVRTVKNVLDRIEGFRQLTGRRHRGGNDPPTVHRHARPLRDRAIVHIILGTGLRRAEVVGLDLDQLDPADPAELRRVKKAKLNGVRGKGRTSRTVFLSRDARHAIADYLEYERPNDVDEQTESLFLAASSIGARRPGGRLSPRSVNTIVGQIGRIHDAETSDRERYLGALRPHDLRHTFGYRPFGDQRPQPRRTRTTPRPRQRPVPAAVHQPTRRHRRRLRRRPLIAHTLPGLLTWQNRLNVRSGSDVGPPPIRRCGARSASWVAQTWSA